MPTDYHIAFWNLENLFDIENSPRRGEKLQRAIGSSLKGWTQARLDRKIAQLASIIMQMNAGSGPDLLGVCEVENDFVLNLLVQALAPLGRNYSIAHHDMSDRRGIDIGFIFDGDLFAAESIFNHVVMRRTATRDILQVNFRTAHNRLLVVIGNHWPSRSGGEFESAGYRAIAGETMAYFHERILEVLGADTPVIAMGDFNDEPFNRSLVDYGLSIRSKSKVLKSKNASFLNLMWPLMGTANGTFYFDNHPNILDQFMTNKNLLKNSLPFQVDLTSPAILKFPEMVAKSTYPKPVPFGGMGKEVNENGFSDHFPITAKISEQD